jgi:hypothetical protein
MHTHQKSSDPVATIGLDIGKSTFHLVGLDKRGAIALRIKVSRSQLARRLANLTSCLVGLEAGSGSQHIAREVRALGHDVTLIPAQYVKPFLKGHKNDYRDAEAIGEAVQRPTMSFVAIPEHQCSRGLIHDAAFTFASSTFCLATHGRAIHFGTKEQMRQPLNFIPEIGGQADGDLKCRRWV